MRRRDPLTLQTQVFLLVITVLMVAAVLIGFIVRGTVKRALIAETGERTLSIAKTVARHSVIGEHLGKANGADFIQPVAESIRIATKAEFVVAIDNDGVRYSHPVPERIGQHVVGGDEAPALRGEEYISTALGTLGTSLRGFAPVYNQEGVQVGAVLVGFLTKDIDAQIEKVMNQVHLAIAAGIAISIFGSIIVADRIKATMFNLEPAEIAAVLEQRSAILASVREGLIAVDAAGRVTQVNQEAERLLGAVKNSVGRPVEEVVPNTKLPRILESGVAELDQEQLINGVVVVTNRVPIIVHGAVVGAVATFRDKTEVKQLAETLTGVRQYVDALRAQTHEFRNRLHRIAGHIQLGNAETALNQIMETVETEQDRVQFVDNHIRPSGLAALLLGKLGRARELGVVLQITDDSNVERLPSNIDIDSLVVIVGNLIENALEAVREEPADRRQVTVALVSAADGLVIKVDDSGPGIPPEQRSTVFQSGVTTKGEGRGLGLTLVANALEGLRGDVEVNVSPLGGASFELFIPWQKGARQ